MLQRTLLLLTVSVSGIAAQAQKSKPVNGYAITGLEKSQPGGWKEVRLLDMSTGQSIQDIYKSNQEIEVFNARTGKKVEIKQPESRTVTTYVSSPRVIEGRAITVTEQRNADATAPVAVTATTQTRTRVYTKDANGNLQLVNVNVNPNVNVQARVRPATEVNVNTNTNVHTTTRIIVQQQRSNAPFATSSAACAYDKKHDRLYYTPMGINQLRYIDLKSGASKIYYFEDEAFGVVAGTWDTDNQITRMSFASDKAGYALSNNANHFIKFTTGKKPEITDLGALTDDAANGQNTVHDRRNYGGDMIADANGNLYLIGANRAIYKINIDSKVATFVGRIKGLPAGFSTNGAMVLEGSKVLVSSSQSNFGYFSFDLNTLQAERYSAEGEVYTAADLANGVLAKVKEEKKDPQPVAVVEEPVVVTDEAAAAKQTPANEIKAGISVYPNPVTERMVKLSFSNQPTGKYNVQLTDMNGQLVLTQEVNIGSKAQVEEIRLPESVTPGLYLVRVVNTTGISHVSKIVVQ